MFKNLSTKLQIYLSLILVQCLFFANIINADDAEIRLNGLLHFQTGAPNQNHLSTDEKKVSANNKNFSFYTDAAINLTATKTINEVVYGAKLILIPTTLLKTSSSYNGSHIFFASEYGKIELGSPYDAGSKMMITAYDISAATGDDWTRYALFDPESMQYNGLSPSFATYDFFHDSEFKGNTKMLNDKTEPSRKISYYTPKYEGFQFGISYIPDSSNTGNAGFSSSSVPVNKIILPNKDSITIDKNVKNAVTLGLSYERNITDDIDIKVAASGEYGKATGKMKTFTAGNVLIEEYKLKDLQSYNLGAILSYSNFAFAASYGSLGKSLTAAEYNKVGRDTHYYNGAVAYKQGPVNTSITYFKSIQFKNISDSISVGAEYQYLPGMLPYVEVSYFSLKGKPVYYPEAPKKSTKGTVLLIGTKLSF